MPVNNTTPNRGYQLPFASNKLNEDVARLIAALGAIDTDMAAAMAGLLTKAAATHGHVISDVAGLQGALDGKMSASVQLALEALSDVNLTGAGDGMFLRRVSGKWSPVAFDAGMISGGTVAEARLPAGLSAAALAAAFAPAGQLSAPTGTLMLFQQTAAPTGWTKQTTHNDKALRVVSGTASSGGSTAFSSVFASRTPAGTVSNTTSTGTVGSTTLAESQIPSHIHGVTTYSSGSGGNNISKGVTTATPNTINTSATGGSGSHNHSLTMDAHGHTFSGTAMNFAVQYVDLIIAAKD